MDKHQLERTAGAALEWAGKLFQHAATNVGSPPLQKPVNVDELRAAVEAMNAARAIFESLKG